MSEAVAPQGTPSSRVRGADLARATSRSLQIQALLTPERMQGPGFAFALVPALRRLYRSRQDLAHALTRHLAYFATHPVLSGYVLGAAARLEERRANGDPIEDEAIDQMKRALASPLAALGDPLFWSTLRPLAGLLGVLAISFPPSPDAVGPDLRVLLCPLFTLLAYNAVALPFRVTGVARGYAEADSPGALVRSLRLKEWRDLLARGGALGYGALLALVALALDLGSVSWGGGGRTRVTALLPLALGAGIGFAGLRRWPGRVVETGLLTLGSAALFAAFL
jgi:mannose/fructose/N-acetylgalactosamine-specific phosphotransferase system component IID